jgi:hypothetical protein
MLLPVLGSSLIFSKNRRFLLVEKKKKSELEEKKNWTDSGYLEKSKSRNGLNPGILKNKSN